MKRIYSLILLLPLISFCNDPIISNPYQQLFNQAYKQYPTVPRGILEAVSYTQTRFAALDGSAEESCMGLPKAFSLFGLIEDGKNYFRNNLHTVANLSGYTIDEIKSSPEKSILAYAKAYSILQSKKTVSSKPEQQIDILAELSELPIDENAVNQFALNAHFYQIFWFLSQGEFQDVYGFPDYNLNLETIFGENYSVLSAKKITAADNSIKDSNGNTFKTGVTVYSADYAPALWNPAASCNYSSRNGTAISAITIHDVEGTYSGCISWFQNCNSNVSAHYVLRSSDGQVTQMVLESNKAWHVGTENPYTIGLEHEGYSSSASWYTNAMYNSSADLCRDICNSGYGINPLRCYHGPSCTGICTLGSCIKIKGHQHFTNSTHSDPGPYWNWYKFYNLINNSPSVNTITAASGTFYDSGGASGNYSNDERDVILIQPPGATNITVNFTQFNLETNWDYMYIYDGATVNDQLIARYTGTSGPGTITSTGGSLLLDFRSDCATTNPGWTANFSGNITTPPTTDNTAPTTSVSTPNAWETQNFTASFADSDNSGGSGVEKGFFQILDYNGTEWRANNNNGFFCDNFDSIIHPDWTSSTGTWGINGMKLEQTDESLSNTNIYASLAQNLSNKYLYHFTMKIDGAGTNRRAGFHFFCDSPDSSNRGNSYFVWFRVDNSKMQIYKAANNSFGSPVLDVAMTVNAGTLYDYKVIYDRITGKIEVYQNNILIGSWTDSAPYSNGGWISFRSGNASIQVDELKVFRSRFTNGTVNVTVGAAASNDVRYQNTNPSTPACKIKTINKDSAGNLSAINWDLVDIDWTPPSDVAYVYDGISSDQNTTTSTTTLAANWGSSADTNSAIAKYWYAIGTNPCDSDVVSWTNNWGSTIAALNNLSLQQGQTYYFNVKAENGAGLHSNCVSSDGILVDTVTITTGIEPAAFSNEIVVSPVPAKDFINVFLSLEKSTDLIISINDLTGREIQSIRKKDCASGITQVRVDLNGAASGIYFIRVDNGSSVHSKKFIKH